MKDVVCPAVPTGDESRAQRGSSLIPHLSPLKKSTLGRILSCSATNRGPKIKRRWLARFFHDADASFTVAEWGYENAERAQALVWVRKGQTARLSGEWRGWFK